MADNIELSAKNSAKIDLSEAHADTNELYKYLSDVAMNTIAPYTKAIDNIVHDIRKGIDNYTNDQLRDYMAKLCVETYSLSVTKEQSELKEACATALYKEKIAKAYSLSTGSVEARKNQSLLDTVDSQAISMLYTAATSILKAKCDEAHRLVSVINGILISRSADAKIAYNPRSEADELPFTED